jgi:hypothetical protein
VERSEISVSLLRVEVEVGCVSYLGMASLSLL